MYVCRYMHTCTCIHYNYRLLTIQNADLIVFIDEGNI